jgi:hypothetical protein
MDFGGKRTRDKYSGLKPSPSSTACAFCRLQQKLQQKRWND